MVEIADLISRDGSGKLTLRYPDETCAKLDKIYRVNGWLWAMYIGHSQLIGILDRVRNLVLSWALELERAGIMGSEFSFTPEEKAKAREAPQ